MLKNIRNFIDLVYFPKAIRSLNSNGAFYH